ncbi:MAG: toprim domain-containing protein [Bacilli bacterium]|jgi:DNA primase
MSSISEYKTYLWDYLQKYHNVTSPKRFFHCLNPNHIDNNPSMMFTDKYNICKCFSCGASYDIYDLIGLDYDLHNFKEQLEKVQELYLGYVPVKKEVKKEIDNKIYDYTNYYNKCFKNRYKTTYLEQRGITRELIDKYKIGYDEERQLVVFPINKHCYFARSVVNNDKIKSRGSSDIWNKKYIKENNQLVYVTEGIIDALSLEVIDPNVKVMSINGVGNINSLIYALKENNFNGTIGIVFDKDGAGKKATDELKKELAKINVNSFSTSMIATFDDISKVKDINMALINNKDLLKRNYEYINSALLQRINKEKEGDGIEY